MNLRPHKTAPAKVLQSLIGPAVFGRLVAVTLLAGTCMAAFSSVQAQVQQPPVNEVSPSVNTEVSSMIHTGCGYDAWTGSVHRSVTDLEVPGAVSSLGLKWVRTYTSGPLAVNNGWTFSWTWRFWGRGWGLDPVAVQLPDGGIWRTNGTEPGNKLRWVITCGPGCGDGHCNLCGQGTADLYLADGSKVHMSFWTDHPNDNSPPVDHYTPEYVNDPYGRQTTLIWEDAYPNTDYDTYLRLKQVIDPSGRSITVTYACAAGACPPDHSQWFAVTRVDGSNGSWVAYNWPRVDYSDDVDHSHRTSAYYTYGDTTFVDHIPCCTPLNCSPCNREGHATELLTAVDTRADSPMQSIKYDYANWDDANPSQFPGQIRTERHLGSDNAEVSTLLISNSTPNGNDATQTERRGDGSQPQRTIHIHKNDGKVPLVVEKQDFENHINEEYTYDSNNYLTDVQDRNDNITHYTNLSTNQTQIGSPTQILHPDQTHIDYTYSDNNNPYYIHTVTDELQTGPLDPAHTTTYTRCAAGSCVAGTNLANLITHIDYPSGVQAPATEDFTYNNFGQVLTHHLRNGAWEKFAYDSTGLLTDRWNPQTSLPSDTDPHTHYDYYGPNDPVGQNAWIDRLKMVTLPGNYCGANCSYQATETYEYDRVLGSDGTTNPSGSPVPARGLVTKITHGAVNTNYNTYQSFGYDALGNKRWEENELRQRTSYTYDDYKRVLTVTNPLGKTTINDYAPTENNTTQSYEHTSNSPYWITTPATIKTHNLYDGDWRRTSSTAAFGTLNLTTTFGYDNVGNVTSATNPRDFQTQNVYDTRNRKTSTTEAYGTNLQRTTIWHYDAANNIYEIDRPDTTQEIKTYDAMHRVLTDTVPKSANPTVNIVTTFNYNPSGTLNWVRDGEGHTYNFAYDAADRKLSMTYPSTGGPQVRKAGFTMTPATWKGGLRLAARERFFTTTTGTGTTQPGGAIGTTTLLTGAISVMTMPVA
jgi:YD repeat-containing protein